MIYTVALSISQELSKHSSPVYGGITYKNSCLKLLPPQWQDRGKEIFSNRSLENTAEGGKGGQKIKLAKRRRERSCAVGTVASFFWSQS